MQHNRRYLLALHSSTDDLGVAVIDLKDENKRIKSSVFKAGRQLSNNLFNYVECLLPKEKWHEIARLAVATGPGSFTGTRLSLIMARTLAQQIDCPLDGISTFALMAPRLSTRLNSNEIKNPFWITKDLIRKGIIAGRYQIIKLENNEKATIEITKPYLLEENDLVKPSVKAIDNVSSDIKELINTSLNFLRESKDSNWKGIVPIYTTSPVGKI